MSSPSCRPNLPVTLQDQQRINRYSYLIYTVTNKISPFLEGARSAFSAQTGAVEELDVLELEGAETVMTREGNAYFHLSLEEARKEAESARREAAMEVERLQADLDRAKEEMGELKKLLESKFGDSIRLE